MTAKEILAKKCRRFHKDEWCGYLTPVEIIAISKVYRPAASYASRVDRAMEDKKLGRCNPGWFYFHVRGGVE